LLAVIEMGLPPMRVYSDCMYVVNTFRNGKDRAMLASNPFADLWGRIFHVAEDYDGQLEVVYTMAHATADDVASGRTTWWERKCNGAADLLAKKGAKLHPTKPDLLRAWQNVDVRAEEVSRFLAGSTARQGHHGVMRDTDAKKPKHAAKVLRYARTCPLEVLPPTSCDRLWPLLCPDVAAPLDHRLFECETELGHSLFFCRRCFAYTTDCHAGKAKLLRANCEGNVGITRLAQRSRILSGLHPQAASGSISPFWPVRESALRRLAACSAPPCARRDNQRPVTEELENPCLEAILEAVGLSKQQAAAPPAKRFCAKRWLDRSIAMLP
jgi:hypothetical protein